MKYFIDLKCSVIWCELDELYFTKVSRYGCSEEAEVEPEGDNVEELENGVACSKEKLKNESQIGGVNGSCATNNWHHVQEGVVTSKAEAAEENDLH